MAPALGIKGLQARITNHFEEKGFNGNQIAKAILVHEILGICLLGTTNSTETLTICTLQLLINILITFCNSNHLGRLLLLSTISKLVIEKTDSKDAIGYSIWYRQ